VDEQKQPTSTQGDQQSEKYKGKDNVAHCGNEVVVQFPFRPFQPLPRQLRFTYVKGGRAMILVKVQYDAYNQRFRLVDPTLSRMFDDGEEYLLAVDIFPTDWEEDEVVGFSPAEIGHA
jgi:hypothetical protein